MAPRASPSALANVDFPDPGKAPDEHQTDPTPLRDGPRRDRGAQRPHLGGVGIALFVTDARHLDPDVCTQSDIGVQQGWRQWAPADSS